MALSFQLLVKGGSRGGAVHRRPLAVGYELFAIRLVAGDPGQAVRLQESNGSSIDVDESVVAKGTEESYGRFHCDASHLSHFFALQRDPDLDAAVRLFAEPLAQFQEQSGQSLARGLKGELIELVHIHAQFTAQELNHAQGQSRVLLNERHVGFFLDQADLGRFQRFARHFVHGIGSKGMLFDQLSVR